MNNYLCIWLVERRALKATNLGLELPFGPRQSEKLGAVKPAIALVERRTWKTQRLMDR